MSIKIKLSSHPTTQGYMSEIARLEKVKLSLLTKTTYRAEAIDVSSISLLATNLKAM